MWGQEAGPRPRKVLLVCKILKGLLPVSVTESLDLVWNKFILTMTPAGKASNVVEGEESQRGDTLEWCHA